MTTKIDFTTDAGGLNWGDDLGTSHGYSFKPNRKVKMESIIWAAVYAPDGTVAVRLQDTAEETWAGHTIDGVATTSFQDFKAVLADKGFTL